MTATRPASGATYRQTTQAGRWLVTGGELPDRLCHRAVRRVLVEADTDRHGGHFGCNRLGCRAGFVRGDGRPGDQQLPRCAPESRRKSLSGGGLEQGVGRLSTAPVSVTEGLSQRASVARREPARGRCRLSLLTMAPVVRSCRTRVQLFPVKTIPTGK
ncbi:MAG: hypothetical protein J07HX5_01286 [halophilic archaeon J07HX5]|nr:MAG: hypothetical protein J07HX5_01286 [halophilic archaeon J07HX5]